MFNNLIRLFRADDVELNLGSGGKTIATLDVAGVQHEKVILEFLSGGVPVMADDAGNPLPVEDVAALAALNSIAGEDFATAANQAIEITSLAAIAAAVSGTEVQVDVVSIIPGVGATNLGKAEDSLHTTGDVGVMSLGVRNDAAAPLAANGDYIPITTDELGAQWIGTIGRASTGNSSTATLLAGAIFTGTSEEVKNYASIQISVISNVASATDGLSLQQSSDGTNWDFVDTYTIAAATAKVFSVQPSARYFRTVYTNGGTNQASFRLMTVYHTNAAKPSSQRPSDAYTNETDLEQQQAFLMGYNETGWDRLRSTIANGLKVDVTRMPGSATDNTQLYSNTIVATGAITGIDTTGYESIVLQFSGVWVGSLLIEGSNDNSTWEPILSFDVNENSIQDVINESGIYVLKTTTKYVRLNVQQLSQGSIITLILGRTVSGIDGADRISLAMDKNNNMPLYVEETGTKKDITKALIPSDAPAPIYGIANSITGPNSILGVIDTTGYQSIQVQLFGTFSASIAFSVSMDGVSFSSVQSYFLSGALSAGTSSTVTAVGVYAIPCAGKFFKAQLTVYSSGTVQMIAFLRQQPVPLHLTNISLVSIGGASPATAGISGVLAIGGNVANGVAPTANPLLMAGIDTSSLTRRILTDTSGRIINALTDQTATTRPVGGMSPAATIQNVAPTAVQDTAQFEGQSQIEILGQILLELRINNQMMSELPLVLAGKSGKFDEPQQYRNDNTLFAI